MMSVLPSTEAYDIFQQQYDNIVLYLSYRIYIPRLLQVTNAGDYIYMVVNGACKHGDMAHFKEQMADFKGDVHMDYLETQQLLALQGKGAPAALQVIL